MNTILPQSNTCSRSDLHMTLSTFSCTRCPTTKKFTWRIDRLARSPTISSHGKCMWKGLGCGLSVYAVDGERVYANMNINLELSTPFARLARSSARQFAAKYRSCSGNLRQSRVPEFVNRLILYSCYNCINEQPSNGIN